MDVFQKMVDDHSYLLNVRGYDEKSLKSKMKQGSLNERLRLSFEKVVSESFDKNRIEHFILQTTGYLAEGTEKVNFKLHYQYNPATQQLRLRGVAAKMDGAQKIFFLKRSGHLPHATKIWEVLTHDRRTRVAKSILNRVPNVKKNRL